MASLELDNSTIVKNLALATEYFKSYYKAAYELKTYSGGTTGFIPFNIEFTLDGISGIKIYDNFVVDTSFLPYNYPKTLDFIVTGISNTLKDGDWETSLKITLIPKFEKTDIKIDSANFQFVKYTPEAPPIVVVETNKKLKPNKLGGIRGDLFSWVPGPNYPDPTNPQNYNGTIYPYKPSDPDFINNLYTETKRLELLNFQKNSYVLQILNEGEASNKRRPQDFISKPRDNPPQIKKNKGSNAYEYYAIPYTEAEQKKMFTDILASISAPASEYNLLWMKIWRDAEGAVATHNPWNSTQKKNNSTKYNVRYKVQNYFSFQDGLEATVTTMTNGLYPTILKALKNGISSHKEMIELAILTQMWDMTGKIPTKWQ